PCQKYNCEPYAAHHRQAPARRGERTDRSRVSDITVVPPPENPSGISSVFSPGPHRSIGRALTMGRGIVMLTLTERPLLTSYTGGLGSGQRTSDEALINAIAAGDRHAMHVLYVRHNVRIYRFVLRLTNHSTLAEDLVSEVFLDVWQRANAF